MPSRMKDVPALSARSVRSRPSKSTGLRRPLGRSLFVFFIGILFTWQIFDLIVYRRLPTMQETMEDSVHDLHQGLSKHLEEQILHLRVMGQILAYRPLISEEDFSLAAADLVERFPEWRWLRYRLYEKGNDWGPAFIAKDFAVPPSLETFAESAHSDKDQYFSVGPRTAVFAIPDADSRYYLVRLLVQRGSEVEGELWAVIDISVLLKSYFASHEQNTYHYVISLGKGALVTDLGYFENLDERRNYQVTRFLRWGAYSLRIDIWPKPYYLNSRALELNMDLAGWVILAMGVLFSLAMGVLAWIVASRTQMLKIEVARRTAELSKKNALLRGKNEEIENFIYTISHDLKSPIVSIQGFAAILKDEFGKNLGEAAVSYIARIQANAVRMHHLIQDLLAFSRIGQVEEKPEPVDVEKLVQEVIEEHHSEIEQKHIKVFVHPELPTIMFPKVRIQQVIDNLITNAIKYSDQGKLPEIHVDMNGKGESDHFYHLRVRDNGIGIDPEYQEKIFQLFQRVHNDRDIEGTGIGLSIVKKIIEQNGGTIHVDSAPGKGSAFTFTIPKEAVTEEAVTI